MAVRDAPPHSSERPSEPSSALGGALLEALAAEGEHVADGQFSIDAERAGQLARKQVGEPQRWPVFLVEVAHVLGAAAIDFHFGGWVVSAELELAGADAGLLELLERFGEGRGPDDPARLLGVVFRAAQAAGADTITIEAVAAEGEGQRCVWRAGDYPRFETCLGAPGLRVWVRYPTSHEDPGLAELGELNRRCRPSTFKVTIDGSPLSVGWVGAFAKFGAAELSHSAPVELDGAAIGLAGVYERPRAGRLLLMQHGVVVEFLPLPEELSFALDGAFTAVAEVSLRRDLSLTRFVRGPEFDAIMAAIHASYGEVKHKAYASVTALATALAPADLSRVDADEHAEDLAVFEQTARSRTTMVGGVCIGLGLASWALVAGIGGAATLLPMALIGAGVLLVLRELG